MKISSRERILLIGMITVLICWLSYDFIIQDQMSKVTELNLQMKLKKNEIEEYQVLLSKESDLDESIKNSYKKVDKVATSFFNTTPQEEMILLMNDFLLIPGLVESGFSFNVPEDVLINEVPFEKQDISLSVSGQYLTVLNLFKTIWEFPQIFQVNDLQLNNSGYDEVTASFTLSTYTFLAETQVIDNLYQWYTDDLFFKDNPFQQYEESDTLVRYLYLPNDTLFNYSRFFEFADIEGHWFQNEIEEYLEYGYLYLNPTLEFGPDEPITRGEMIVLIDSIYEWNVVVDEIDVDLTSFRDYEDLGSLESAFAKAIHRGYLSGFVEGFQDNTLRPRDPMTYREVEYLMNRIKGTTDFTWESVIPRLSSVSGTTKPEWYTDDGQITKAEAVFLMYYFK